MKETITPHTVANTAMMIRDAQSMVRPVLLVEGQSDVRMLQHCVGARVDLVPSAGKDNVLGALEVLRVASGEHGWYLAILDADFDRILAIERAGDAVAVTDLHDLECEYLHSDALVKVLREYASPQRMAGLLGGSPDRVDWLAAAQLVRDQLHKAGTVFGALRFVSVRGALELDFKDVRHSSALKPKSVEVDARKLVELLAMKNPGKIRDQRTLAADLGVVLREGHDPWQLCQGHDLVALFELGMRRIWSASPPSDGVVEKSLRLGFEAAYFFATGHGSRVEQFIRSNTGELRLAAPGAPI